MYLTSILPWDVQVAACMLFEINIVSRRHLCIVLQMHEADSSACRFAHVLQQWTASEWAFGEYNAGVMLISYSSGLLAKEFTYFAFWPVRRCSRPERPCLMRPKQGSRHASGIRARKTVRSLVISLTVSPSLCELVSVYACTKNYSANINVLSRDAEGKEGKRRFNLGSA